MAGLSNADAVDRVWPNSGASKSVVRISVCATDESGYKHVEAFCRMKYVDDRGNAVWIWNSRDGVTPYVVSIEGREFRHVEWHRDRQRPNHVPEPGEYVFVDLSLEEAEKIARQQVEAHWGPPTSLCKRYSSIEAASNGLVEDYYGNGHQPHLIIVGPEGWPPDENLRAVLLEQQALVQRVLDEAIARIAAATGASQESVPRYSIVFGAARQKVNRSELWRLGPAVLATLTQQLQGLELEVSGPNTGQDGKSTNVAQ